MPAIVYESNTGFTRRYAEILSEKTDFEVYPLVKAVSELPESTEIFFMGWVCGGKIEGLKPAQKHFDVLACAAVGASLPSPETTVQLTRMNALHVPLFYLRGGVAPDKLSRIKRKLLEMIAKQVEHGAGDQKANWELADVLRFGGDFVAEENLAEILAWFAEQK